MLHKDQTAFLLSGKLRFCFLAPASLSALGRLFRRSAEGKVAGSAVNIAVFLGGLLLCLGMTGALATEYVSVSSSTAILYDANSTKAKKLYVLSRYTPLETVVNLQNWIKVRDSSGTLAWIERRAVSDRQYVVVTVPLAAVRKAPEANAPVLYQVAHHVVMESLGVNGAGWIKARHLDGSVGYMRSLDVWGVD
jgi:SH3-like domain-containing protein